MAMTATLQTQNGATIRIEQRTEAARLELEFQMASGPPCVLHWGLRLPHQPDWQLPPQAGWPNGSRAVGRNAVQTPFASDNGGRRLVIRLDASAGIAALEFVLFFPEQNKWDNNQGRNYRVALSAAETGRARLEEGLAEIARTIIAAETTHNSWTLMHRFNLCYELLDQVGDRVEGMALLFVWLRFSAIRQLTWQKNYNTQPRELSHSQERLTGRLADIYARQPALRPLARLMLSSVGRGGEGQRIRDEILNIMHRRHIKEVTGHFLEEWHQKLHNNTTPDDVVICEAYLDFLRHNGSLDRFYQTLRHGGVTPERLAGFERPIRTDPGFVPHLKDALIEDFQHFLKILKAVHSGTDLETAIQAARGQLDGGIQNLLGSIWQRGQDARTPLIDLVNAITDARRRLAGRLAQPPGTRDLLYLDLALEQFVRMAVERNIHLKPGADVLVELVARILVNLGLSQENAELAVCLRHWERLVRESREGPGWSLHAKAVLDRIGRGLGAMIDQTYQLLQPKAEHLGRAFGAEDWTVLLFSEEVVRGGSLGFVLSAVLGHLDPILRQGAHLGRWQIISRGGGWGKVEVTPTLRSVQGKVFDSPRVIITDQVLGDEEIPPGVTAVIAPDVTDIVSHVAVRARNTRLLFAACYDAATLQWLKSMAGRFLRLEVTAAGDVAIEETGADIPGQTAGGPPAARRLVRPEFTVYAVAADEFRPGIVGSKSYHQTLLRGKLPAWIQQPRSAALPFGVFERVLSLKQNDEVRRRYEALVRGLDRDYAPVLTQIRRTILDLAAPEELVGSLRRTLDRAGLPWPADWTAAWRCIRQVWASKWNERAYLNRQARGIDHEDLVMAVLVQDIVPAQYAFVIHTVNPFAATQNELYAEVVLGLGETLVGNYPGRALSFLFDKTSGKLGVMAYPGKSVGLYGKGLIFRSDSNGEDLAGYAGAGLYDSVCLEPPRPALLDYTEEPLVWDPKYRDDLLGAIARMGIEVERLLGGPQDIEGAWANGQIYIVQSRPQVGL